MGLLNTVIKRQESSPAAVNVPNASEERKLLMNINSRVEDLKLQNFENAKFLRGISRKIEEELNQMHELDENRSIEVYDDTNLLESIERVEKSLSDINNEEVLEAIDRINTTIKEMNSGEVMEAIETVRTSLQEMDNTAEVIEAIEKLKESLQQVNHSTEMLEALGEVNRKLSTIDTEKVLREVEQIEAALKQISNEQVLEELSKLDAAVRMISPEGVMEELAKTNGKLDELKAANPISEIHRVEEMVAEISDKAVLSELERIRMLIHEKNSREVVNSLDEKLKNLSPKDYTDSLLEIKQMLSAMEQKNEELGRKVDRVASMPTMVKSVLDKTNGENISRMEELIADINNQQRKKTDTLKTMISVNMWVSIMTLAILVAKILELF